MERPNKPKYKCIFCDGECSLDHYTKNGTLDEIEYLLRFWKVCTPHARKLDEAHTKKELEQQVA